MYVCVWLWVCSVMCEEEEGRDAYECECEGGCECGDNVGGGEKVICFDSFKNGYNRHACMYTNE